MSTTPRPTLRERLRPLLTPYHFLLVGLIGAGTAAFAALIGVLLLVATNFNLLGAIE